MSERETIGSRLLARKFLTVEQLTGQTSAEDHLTGQTSAEDEVESPDDDSAGDEPPSASGDAPSVPTP